MGRERGVLELVDRLFDGDVRHVEQALADDVFLACRSIRFQRPGYGICRIVGTWPLVCFELASSVQAR